MARHRATDLIGPRTRRISGLCLCSGCRPSPILKRTFVCLKCRTTQRRTSNWKTRLEKDGPLIDTVDPICTSCRGPMKGIPLTYSAAVPGKTHDRAWKLLERSLARPLEPKPDREWYESKTVSNRRQKRKDRKKERVKRERTASTLMVEANMKKRREKQLKRLNRAKALRAERKAQGLTVW